MSNLNFWKVWCVHFFMCFYAFAHDFELACEATMQSYNKPFWLLRVILLKLFLCDLAVASSPALRVPAYKHIAASCFSLCLTSGAPRSVFCTLSCSLWKETKVAFDFNQMTGRVIFYNPTAYCTPHVYFNRLAIQMLLYSKALEPYAVHSEYNCRA